MRCYHSGLFPDSVAQCPPGFRRLWPSDICCGDDMPNTGGTQIGTGTWGAKLPYGKGTGNQDKPLVLPPEGGNPPPSVTVGGAVANGASGTETGGSVATQLVPVQTASTGSGVNLTMIAAVIGIAAGAWFLWEHFHKKAA